MLQPKYKFIETDSIDLGDMFDLPMERRHETARDLNKMSEKIGAGTATLRQIIQFMENIVDNQEEFLFAYTVHLHYMLKNGRYAFSGDKEHVEWLVAKQKKGKSPW